jgi:hypothetical protein
VRSPTAESPTCAYRAFSEAYHRHRDQAAGRGWPVSTLPGSHLHPLTDPRAGSAQSPLRQEFAETFGDRQKLRKDVKRRVERANVRLRAEQPALYDEYDRLRSEGEFRVAVAPPVAAIVIGTCLLVARLPTHIKPTINTLRALKWVSLSGDQLKATSSTVWRLLGGLLLTTAAGLIVFSLMFAAGRGRTRSATDLLYASVRQEVIENRDEPDLRPTDFG